MLPLGTRATGTGKAPRYRPSARLNPNVSASTVSLPGTSSVKSTQTVSTPRLSSTCATTSTGQAASDADAMGVCSTTGASWSGPTVN